MSFTENKEIIGITAFVAFAAYVLWIWSNIESIRLARLQISQLQGQTNG